MNVGDKVETLYESKGYARGVVLVVGDDKPMGQQTRVLIQQIAGENRVFHKVQPFERNCITKYCKVLP